MPLNVKKIISKHLKQKKRLILELIFAGIFNLEKNTVEDVYSKSEKTDPNCLP